jgi:hypothetical protein
MRLMVLLLMVLTAADATPRRVLDLNGVWIAGTNTCEHDVSLHCNRIILNVTREGNRLKVIKIISGEAGSSIAERQYVFKGILGSVGQGIGTARTDGRSTILQYSDQFERWSISEDGSELIVGRWIGVSPKAPQPVLIFQRSNDRLE